MFVLEGRTALIFGGRTGIGAAVGSLFEQAGARVLIADLFDKSEIAENNRDALFCDVSDKTNVEQVVDVAIQRLGHIDILINNAGVGTPAQDVQDIPTDVWSKVFAVNVAGSLFAIQAVIPHMINRGYGRIINTASQLAHKPAPKQSAYSASKAALVAMTVSIAQEVASKGITVNCVCPGPTGTNMWHGSDPNWKNWKTEQLPIRRIGTADEIASAYLYLASDAASFMIGQSISPNGGDVMW
ncbi:SDR family NAD(P)-dependent oxidoreductase [Rhizobium sp. LjRoot98]|uniref:SDR family NAD(P)-dependent oxidoreductase n=1 Tax=Rhizobium sp. LjRoot98 TaxID=3342345 RepID=UPI003ECE06FB